MTRIILGFIILIFSLSALALEPEIGSGLAFAESRTRTYEYYTGGGVPNGTKGKLKKETRILPTENLITEYQYTDYGYLWKKTIHPDYPANPLTDITYETDYDTLGQVTATHCPRSGQHNFEYTYDYRGNQKTITTHIDPNTHYLTTLDYDLMDNLVTRTEDSESGGLNIITAYTYDNLNRLTDTVVDCRTGGLNITTHNAYDDEGRLTQVVDPEGASTIYEYYDNGWLFRTARQLKPSLYATTYYFYDANGNQTQVTDPEGHDIYSYYSLTDKLIRTEVEIETTIDPTGKLTTIYTRDPLGRITGTTDPKGYTTYTFYDALGRVKYVRTPQSNITTAYVYDNAGRTTQVIGPWYDDNHDGSCTGEYRDLAQTLPPVIHHSGYDKADRLTDTWVTAGANEYPHTVYGYDQASNVTDVTDQLGVVTHNDYDRCHELTKTTVDYGDSNLKTKYEYDMVGRQIKVTAGYETDLAQVTETVYDKASRVEKTFSYPAGSSTELYATHYEYNARGQQTKVYDAEGWVADPQYYTEYQYDLGGRLLKVINAKGDYTRYEYNKDSNRTKVIYVRNSSEVETTYTYYNNHLLHTTVYPGFSGSNTTTNVYDGNGNLTSKTDGKSQTINYEYDFNNRLKKKTYPDYSEVNYTYDANSNLLTTVDANTDTENQYDDLNRLTTVTNKKYPSPYKVIQYTYWDDGLRKTMTDPESNLTEYSYDNAKRLDIVKLNSTQQADYDYNALGLRTKVTLGNGSYTDYAYDSTTKWLTGVTNMKSDQSTIISSFVYEHDKVGNRTKMTLASTDYIDYTYDHISQLTNEVRTGSTPYALSWSYDEVGNRLIQVKNSVQTNYTYNDANQLITTVEGGTITTNYTYDNNGNQIGKTIGSDEWTWNYDYENRQTLFNAPGTDNDSTYMYDASGVRIAKTVNNVTVKHILDGANVICDYDSSNTLKASYVTPFLDQNLLVTRYSPLATNYYYMQDGLGSVRNVIDAGQTTQNAYDYTAFGEALNWSENISNRYAFTGREWDNESQTCYYRARQYNSYNGRFDKRDPLEYGSGINLYGYVKNNPVGLIDPYGYTFVYAGEKLSQGLGSSTGKFGPGTGANSLTEPRVGFYTKQHVHEGCCCIDNITFILTNFIYYPSPGNRLTYQPLNNPYSSGVEKATTANDITALLIHERIHAEANVIIGRNHFDKAEKECETCISLQMGGWDEESCAREASSRAKDAIGNFTWRANKAAGRLHNKLAYGGAQVHDVPNLLWEDNNNGVRWSRERYIKEIEKLYPDPYPWPSSSEQK